MEQCNRRILGILISSIISGSCTFNFELTSQRTALENQVLGTYKEIEDELILVSAVRGPNAGKSYDSSDTRARNNQDFNRDDIEELKQKKILGETSKGELIGTDRLKTVDKSLQLLATELVAEENKDRYQIWQKIIQENKNLTEKHLPEIRSTYAKIILERSPKGYLFLSDQNIWTEKR
jgi:hypothetical protein